MLRSVTKAAELSVQPQYAFTYLAAIDKWPEWSTYGVREAKPAGSGGWHVKTFRGTGMLIMRAEARTRLLDYEFIDSESNRWIIPARVVASPSGSVFIRTFNQPPAMPDGYFGQLMDYMEEEIRSLKRAIVRWREKIEA